MGRTPRTTGKSHASAARALSVARTSPFWNLSASTSGGVKHLDVQIHGVIDGGWLDDQSVSTADVVAELQEHADAKTITVHINSMGGSAFGGIAIYNALTAHPAEVACIVEGLAASAASLIAMAGRTVMGRGAVMMIHSPMVMAMGNAAELRKQADMLDKIQGSLVSIYTDKTGKSAEEVNALLDEETWMTAEEAVDAGFADEVASDGEAPQMTANGVVWSGVRFPTASLPSQVLAMAKAIDRTTNAMRQWSPPNPSSKTRAPRAEQKGKAMPDMDKLKEHAQAIHDAAQGDHKAAGPMCEAMAPHMKALHDEMGDASPFHGGDDDDDDDEKAQAVAIVKELGGVSVARGTLAAMKKTAAAVESMQKEIAQAKAEKESAEVKALLDEAMADGRLNGAADRTDAEKFHAEHGTKALAAFVSRLPKKPVAAREPSVSSAAGASPTAQAAAVTATLTAADIELCKRRGRKPEEYAAFKAQYMTALKAPNQDKE